MITVSSVGRSVAAAINPMIGANKRDTLLNVGEAIRALGRALSASEDRGDGEVVSRLEPVFHVLAAALAYEDIDV